MQTNMMLIMKVSKRKMKHLKKTVQLKTDDELDNNDSDADTDISGKR